MLIPRERWKSILRQIREGTGKSQEDVQRESGVSWRTVSRIENGSIASPAVSRKLEKWAVGLHKAALIHLSVFDVVG